MQGKTSAPKMGMCHSKRIRSNSTNNNLQAVKGQEHDDEEVIGSIVHQVVLDSFLNLVSIPFRWSKGGKKFSPWSLDLKQIWIVINKSKVPSLLSCKGEGRRSDKDGGDSR